MFKLLANKYLLGAAGLLLALAAIWGYGRYQHAQGWSERDTQAKLDLAARQTALYNEQVRLEHEKLAAEQRYQALKADTAARVADLDADAARLRQRLSAYSKHPAAGATSRTDDANPDWIGIVAACWSDYASLGKKAATYADRVNGLQAYVQSLMSAQR
ncbi:hypothetical protein ERD78_18950 [Allopusillimonas soli]|uniref:Lysis protein n=1 Tax=Allopusillimonas soli TaxID=659016 RepID=A0A853FGT7_9BURK|nr:hypothetical protein [Allopusillimonas soli]NYT38852.1 hypothetical protein [Allopusillimonas soli]TEA70148.1 hypothetical protein ERD78_18950 [Allopusillimonas soli]